MLSLPSFHVFILCFSSFTWPPVEFTREGSYFIGPYQEVSVRGDFAFCLAGYGFDVLDVSDPQQPKRVSHRDMEPSGIVILGDFAFIVDFILGLRVLDISNPAAFHQVSQIDLGSGGVAIDAVGEYLYLLHWSHGLVIVDVKNPEVPVIVKKIEEIGLAGWDLDIAEELAVILEVWRGGNFTVLDITDPEDPVVRSQMTFNHPERVHLKDRRAFLACKYPGSLEVIELADPEHPRILGSLEMSNVVSDVWASEDFVYVCFKGLKVFDGRDPADLQLVAELTAPDWYPQSIDPHDGKLFLSDHSHGLRIVDIEDPHAPRQIGRFDSPRTTFGEFSIHANHAWLLEYGNHLYALDISKPEAPQLRGTIELPHRGQSIRTYGEFAYVMTYQEQESFLNILDISDPGQIESLSENLKFSGYVRDFVISWPYMYLSLTSHATANSRLATLDIRDPTQPYEKSSLPDVSGRLTLHGDRLFGTSPGLFVLDIGNPANPVLEELEFPEEMTQCYFSDLIVRGNCGYALTRFNSQFQEGISTLDFRQPLFPSIMGQHRSLQGTMYSISVSDQFAFTSATYAVDVTDIADPFKPEWMGRIRVPFYAGWGPDIVHVQGEDGRVYLVDRDIDRFYIYRIDGLPEPIQTISHVPHGSSWESILSVVNVEAHSVQARIVALDDRGRYLDQIKMRIPSFGRQVIDVQSDFLNINEAQPRYLGVQTFDHEYTVSELHICDPAGNRLANIEFSRDGLSHRVHVCHVPGMDWWAGIGLVNGSNEPIQVFLRTDRGTVFPLPPHMNPTSSGDKRQFLLEPVFGTGEMPRWVTLLAYRKGAELDGQTIVGTPIDGLLNPIMVLGRKSGQGGIEAWRLPGASCTTVEETSVTYVPLSLVKATSSGDNAWFGGVLANETGNQISIDVTHFSEAGDLGSEMHRDLAPAEKWSFDLADLGLSDESGGYLKLSGESGGLHGLHLYGDTQTPKRGFAGGGNPSSCDRGERLVTPLSIGCKASTMIFLINDNSVSASVKMTVSAKRGLERAVTAKTVPPHGALLTGLTELNLPGNEAPESLVVASSVEIVGVKLEYVSGCFQEKLHLATSLLMPLPERLDF